MAVETVQSNDFRSRGRGYANINLFTSTDYVSVGRRNVNVSVSMDRKASYQTRLQATVKVMLQKEVKGMWHYVDSKTVYVSPDEHRHPKFTNVSSAYKLRVRFQIEPSFAYPTKLYYLPIW